MQKQQLTLKSLKIHLCFWSWSNFPARNHCDLKLELLYLCPLYCVDLVKATVLCIIEKMGIAGKAERSSSRLEFVSWDKEKFRHKAQLLLSVSCVLHVARYQQMFEHKYLSVLTGFAVLYLLLLYFAWVFLLLLLCYIHIHTCAMHMRRSLLKGHILKMLFFENLWG